MAFPPPAFICHPERSEGSRRGRSFVHRIYHFTLERIACETARLAVTYRHATKTIQTKGRTRAGCRWRLVGAQRRPVRARL
jgi:hypothetical protein